MISNRLENALNAVKEKQNQLQNKCVLEQLSALPLSRNENSKDRLENSIEFIMECFEKLDSRQKEFFLKNEQQNKMFMLTLVLSMDPKKRLEMKEFTKKVMEVLALDAIPREELTPDMIKKLNQTIKETFDELKKFENENIQFKELLVTLFKFKEIMNRDAKTDKTKSLDNSNLENKEPDLIEKQKEDQFVEEHGHSSKAGFVPVPKGGATLASGHVDATIEEVEDALMGLLDRFAYENSPEFLAQQELLRTDDPDDKPSEQTYKTPTPFDSMHKGPPSD